MNTVGCDEFRAFVDPYMDGEFDERERALFDAHHASCSDCQDFLEQKSWLLDAVKPLLRQPCQMSNAARNRLNKRLSVAQRPEKARAAVRWLARPIPALTLMAAAVVLILPLTGFNASIVVDDLVDQHRQKMPVEVPTAVNSEVESWLNGKLPFTAAPPKFRDQRVSLLGARLSRIRMKQEQKSLPAAQLLYRVGSHKMSVLVFDGRGSIDLKENIQMVGDRPVQIHDRHGHRVALFHVGDLTYAVTSDLPTQDIVEVIGTSL